MSTSGSARQWALRALSSSYRGRVLQRVGVGRGGGGTAAGQQVVGSHHVRETCQAVCTLPCFCYDMAI